MPKKRSPKVTVVVPSKISFDYDYAESSIKDAMGNVPEDWTFATEKDLAFPYMDIDGVTYIPHESTEGVWIRGEPVRKGGA